MSQTITGYLSRSYLLDTLREMIEAKSKIPVSSGENQGYELGHALGYVDALKEVAALVRDLPDDPKPTSLGKAWHQSP